MTFFKSFLASFFAFILGIIIAIPIMFIVAGGLFSSLAGSAQERLRVAPNSVLKINFNFQIVEDAVPDPIEIPLGKYIPGAGSSATMGLYQIIESIEKAAEDPNIRGIYLNPGIMIQTGWASLKSIRDALIAFKAEGKWIYAHAEIMTEKAYYICSVADRIAMPSDGMLEFNGIAASPIFYKGLFDKLGVEPQVFKVGTFKSAVEPYLLTEMSEANKEQTRILLDDVWSVISEEISASRGLSLPKVNELAENFIFGDAALSMNAGLIDMVQYESPFLDQIKGELGLEPDDTLPLVSLKNYLRAPNRKKSSLSGPKVAVIFAEGAIQSGSSSPGTIGSQTVVKALRKARKDPNVKAVVLRINSPGGSSLASDVISAEVAACAKVKTIVASMGDYAASGGYYLAAKTDKIFAQPNTITGSIGIFSILFEPGQLLNQHLGITVDEVETHSSANIGVPGLPLTEKEKAFFQKQTHRGYSRFINVVKEGRDFADSLTVDKIAQGRVWSGTQAIRINLVDELGSLQDAIAYAASNAGLEDDYRVIRYSAPQSPLSDLLGELGETSLGELDAIREELSYLLAIKQAIPNSGTYALMPYIMEIK